MADQPQGCARVTGTVVGNKPSGPQTDETNTFRMEKTMAARVGQKAPEFSAPAYCRGAFTSVKLADYLGKWLVLCFYPGDFTFV
jgi:peroxiredoxin (alkyl hydroperoxide reductase subunit C)